MRGGAGGGGGVCDRRVREGERRGKREASVMLHSAWTHDHMVPCGGVSGPQPGLMVIWSHVLSVALTPLISIPYIQLRQSPCPPPCDPHLPPHALCGPHTSYLNLHHQPPFLFFSAVWWCCSVLHGGIVLCGCAVLCCAVWLCRAVPIPAATKPRWPPAPPFCPFLLPHSPPFCRALAPVPDRMTPREAPPPSFCCCPACS